MSKAFTKEDDAPDVVVPRMPAPRAPAEVSEEVAASGVVRAGAFVRLSDGAEYQIVEPAAADTAARRISVDSPLGRALLGRRAGDSVTVERPRGEIELTIARVRY